MAVVVLTLGLFVFLYFTKSNNNTDSEKKQSSIPTVTETSTEKETEVTTTEAETETETETETEEETEYDENFEDDNDFTKFTLRLYKGLPYYQSPDYDSKINGKITSTALYTIVDEAYDDNNERWGKLLSGVGWVNISENLSWTDNDTSYYNPSLYPVIKKKTVSGITFLYRKVSDSNNNGSYSENIYDLKISKL